MSKDRWAHARKTIADMRRVSGVPDSERPDGVVSTPEFSGHKAIYLANLEGFLGGLFPALLAERDRLEHALRAACADGWEDGDGAMQSYLHDAEQPAALNQPGPAEPNTRKEPADG